MLSEEQVKEFLKQKSDGSLYHRESKDLEFKEQFNLAGLAEYFRDFAGFSNNEGGYIIFGVTNSPRKLTGLSPSSLSQFEKIDPEKISGFLLDVFSPDIHWEQQIFEIDGKNFGVFYVTPNEQKPVIAKKNEGRDQEINSGDIFFRYGGRTQKIQFAELARIISQRIQTTNNQWMSLMGKIAKTGPANAAILDTEKGVIEKDERNVLVIDEDLAKKIKFIRQGSFHEGGKTTLRLVGDVRSIESVEVTKTIQKRLTDQYPFSATQLVKQIKARYPNVKQHIIYNIIKDNGLKNDTNYSAYNFPNKEKEIEYLKSGKISPATPIIYNKNAVDYIMKILDGGSVQE